MDKLTFDQLPNAVSTLLNEVRELRQLLTDQSTPEPTNPENDFITIAEACEILNVSKVTLWRYEKQDKIKVYGIGGRRLLKRSEVMDSLILKK